MEIILNGEAEVYEAPLNLQELLQRLELSPEVVSITLNGRAVPKAELAQVFLREKDKVEVLLFMGGGV